MRPAAVILDFDGVVVASLDAHLAAWSAAVVEVFGGPPTDPAELAGHASPTIAHILCKRCGDPTRYRLLLDTKERLLLTGAADLPLLPGARAMVAELASRRLPFAIASNSQGPFVRGAVTALGLSVPVIVTGSDVSKGKPEPAIFWECANRLGVPPQDRGRTLVFEDSPHGLKGARRAGMVPLGIATGQTADALATAGARAVCRDLAEALALGWLDRIPGG